MKEMGNGTALWLVTGLSLTMAACGSSVSGSGGGVTPPATTTYTLTVNSATPASGAAITVTPADTNSAGNGSTSFTRSYAAGTAVTLTAAATAGGNGFSSWTGCTTATKTTACSVTMNANTTVTATYAANAITSIAVTPSPAAATIGSQLQFAAAVAGTGSFGAGVTWSVAAPSGSTLSPGTISSTGLYITPYPAPATVTVTATSSQDTTKSGSVVVALSQPAAAAGPALTVNVAGPTLPINPYIYGMNAFSMAQSTGKAVNLSVDRWGGDATSLYNYQLDVTNAGSDWYFMNGVSATGQQDTGAFNAQFLTDQSVGAKTMGTIPLLGWVAKNGTSCSFSVAKYGAQQAVNPYNSDCGNGKLLNGNNVANDPNDVATTIDTSYATNWVKYLVSKFGTAAKGGVAIYDLDNEPDWWDGGHIDVHPKAFTYDEVVNRGIGYAKAVKASDPTAEVSGPVMSMWWDFFYSKKDVEAGWGTGPCFQPWANPVDRNAHNGVPLLDYYLQQFKAAESTSGMRLLDYLDLHTYFAANYNGSGVGLATAGDTGEQQTRLNSTRVFWDSTYTDPNYPQPNYPTDANYTSSCNVPLVAPQMIPRMHNWVNADYPGTKLAITEYNWGGQEHINGAVAQADILGIFGREGLDLGTLWGPPDPVKQIPGLMAFEIYRNYDGNNAQFGDLSLSSVSGDQSRLSVYGALRSSDGAVTVMVINKTYGDLTDTLSLPGLTPNGKAQVFQYSNANLAGIVAQAGLTVTPPATGSTTSTVSATFPAQSITLLVIPKL
jgi:hypothetical protein